MTDHPYGEIASAHKIEGGAVPDASSSDTSEQGRLATAFYNGRDIVVELNDEGFDALAVGSVELTPEQAQELIAELQASVNKAKTSR